MAAFFPVFGWGLLLLAALLGWGRLLALVVRRGCKYEAQRTDSMADWLDSPAWGIAASSLIGGILNLAGLAGRGSVLAYVFIGVAFAVFFALRAAKTSAGNWPPWPRLDRDQKWLLVLTLVSLIIVARFSSAVMIYSYFPYNKFYQGVSFNPQDDALSYIVSPIGMLQTGSLGVDPFNARQMMSGLGAQHFLNAMMLVFFRPENAHLLDGGVGLVATCLAAAGFALRLGLGRMAVTLLLFIPLAARPFNVNISSALTTVAMLIALASALRELWREPSNARGRGAWLIMAGLLLAAACSLKSSAIPTACFSVGASACLLAFMARQWRPIGTGLLIGVVALAAMSPWMLWQYHSSGTPLYPVLGLGGHVNAYHPEPPALFQGKAVKELEEGVVLPLCLVVLFITALFSRKIRRAVEAAPFCVVLGLLLGWLVAWPALAVSTELADVSRYLAPARQAALIITVALFWRWGERIVAENNRPRGHWLGAGALVVVLAIMTPEWTDGYGLIIPQDLDNSLHGAPYAWSSLEESVHAMQAAIPAGEKALVYLDAPFLLDFNRNPLFVADWPGEASPPPGLPVNAGPAAVAQYLRSQGIHYIAYAYANHANFSPTDFHSYLDPIMGRVVNRTAAASFAFQDDLTQLAKTYHVIYDDKQAFVIDLDQSLSSKDAVPVGLSRALP